MSRLNLQRQKELGPKRLEYAIAKIQEIGGEHIEEGEKAIKFIFKGNVITLYPYSGWFTGKSIRDGRGIEYMIQQLKNL